MPPILESVVRNKSDQKYSAAWIASQPKEIRERWLASLQPQQLELLASDWNFWAREDQIAPLGNWRNWLVVGGRGAGKTRTGAEWIRQKAISAQASHIALIGETLADAREVMVAGVSGLIAVHGMRDRPTYEASRRRLVWSNGACAYIFSAEDPESLRGPQFDTAWCDEIGKWRLGQETWDMLTFGMRLGDCPQVCATTTPRNTPLLRLLLGDDRTMVTRSPTRLNRVNLARGFIQELERRYGGSRLGRQEIDGEMLTDDPEALWNRATIDRARVREAPPLVRCVVGVDPNVSSKEGSNSCGIVVAGTCDKGHNYVLADRTIRSAKPMEWAVEVQRAICDFDADTVVAEVNQGGELITVMLRQAGVAIPIRAVHARVSKAARAAPIAVQYERGAVSHVGLAAELEDQMCTWKIGDTPSPDRLDALVWALDHIIANRGATPRMRQM